MATRFAFNISAILILVLAVTVSSHSLPSKFFNVVNYGAIGDGKKDNTQVTVGIQENSVIFFFCPISIFDGLW